MKVADEKKLILLLKRSDVKAFDTLFTRYHGKVLGFCYQITGSKEESEEIGQTVFLAIWENRHIIDEERPVETYIFSITRHHLYNALKRKAFRKAVETKIENTFVDYEFDLEEQLYYNDINNSLQKIIDTLPSKRKEIFLLSRNEGLSYKKIAEVLNISENTVDTQIRNALDYIRPLMRKFL